MVAFNADVLRKLARLWALVLVANIAGCAAITFALARAPIVPSGEQGAFASVAHMALAADPLTTFWRAILAGWLIALMVWLLPAAEGGANVMIVVGLTYLIAIGGFSHIVAGSVDAFYELFRGHTTLGIMFGTFFVPTLLGNIVGGVTLVSLLGFGQVFEDHIAPGGQTGRAFKLAAFEAVIARRVVV